MCRRRKSPFNGCRRYEPKRRKRRTASEFSRWRRTILPLLEERVLRRDSPLPAGAGRGDTKLRLDQILAKNRDAPRGNSRGLARRWARINFCERYKPRKCATPFSISFRFGSELCVDLELRTTRGVFHPVDHGSGIVVPKAFPNIRNDGITRSSPLVSVSADAKTHTGICTLEDVKIIRRIRKNID